MPDKHAKQLTEGLAENTLLSTVVILVELSLLSLGFNLDFKLLNNTLKIYEVLNTVSFLW